MSPATRAAAVLVAGLVAASGLSGAAAAPTLAPAAAFCIPIPRIWECDTEEATPEPTPTPTPSETAAEPEEQPAPAPAPTEEAAEEPVEAVPDDAAPVFTQPPAQMGSDSLSFTGLRGISIVTVPLADGSRATALKISADTITVDGFALTVGHADAPGLVTTANRMTLSGDVSVYLNSLTATTQGGASFTLGADTPPPKDGIEPVLLRVTFGLVGATADAISYTNTDQRMVD